MTLHSSTAFMLKVEKKYIAVIIRIRGKRLDSFRSNFSISTQVVNVLRSQLTQLEEIKKERETMEGEIKAVTFDMSVTFLTALGQDGAINEEQLSVAQLDQLYGAYNQRVQASLRSQEELLGQVQVYKHKNITIVCLKKPFLILLTSGTCHLSDVPPRVQQSETV